MFRVFGADMMIAGMSGWSVLDREGGTGEGKGEEIVSMLSRSVWLGSLPS